VNAAAKAVLLMAVLPWLPWIVDDWLTSETRIAMNPTERSIYQDLLAFQWRDGHLSSDHQILAGLAAVTPEVFEAAAPAVLKHFNLRRGRLRNKKLAILRESALEKCTKMARRGQKGGEAKASKVKDICASSTPQAHTRAPARSDSVSIPGVVSGLTEEENLAPRVEAFTGNGREDQNALALACKVQVWDRYPGVKTEDDYRLVMSLCGTREKLALMVAALDGWILKWAGGDPKFIPFMRKWLGGTAEGGARCWAPPPSRAKSADEVWLEKKKAQQVKSAH
jgi:uncharacterized protein YdaU (DUF1376 family)